MLLLRFCNGRGVEGVVKQLSEGVLIHDQNHCESDRCFEDILPSI
jgi:hypothetical protein